MREGRHAGGGGGAAHLHMHAAGAALFHGHDDEGRGEDGEGERGEHDEGDVLELRRDDHLQQHPRSHAAQALRRPSSSSRHARVIGHRKAPRQVVAKSRAARRAQSAVSKEHSTQHGAAGTRGTSCRARRHAACHASTASSERSSRVCFTGHGRGRRPHPALGGDCRERLQRHMHALRGHGRAVAGLLRQQRTQHAVVRGA